MKVAAIDIGTNAVMMCIAEDGAGSSLRIVHDEVTITRLGRGVDATGVLDAGAAARTLEVLDGYAKRARTEHARIVAVGTSALRDARNAGDFLTAARALLGDLEIISGSREAALTFAGALVGVRDVGGLRSCVVDVGGGSTEIVVGEGTRVGAACSLQLGSVRLYERFLAGEDPPSPTAISALRDGIDAALRDAFAGPHIDVAAAATRAEGFVAVAGTATQAAAIALDVDPGPAGTHVHGVQLSRAQLGTVVTRLASTSVAQRAAMRGMTAGRADVIVVGALLLERIATALHRDTLTISNGGVRIGLAREALSRASQPGNGIGSN